MCYLAKTAKGMVDMVTGQLVEQLEFELEEVKQPSVEVDETTVSYIVKQIFGSDMPDHSITLLNRTIYLDGISTYSIKVAEYDNRYDLYIHLANDRAVHCRQGYLV